MYFQVNCENTYMHAKHRAIIPRRELLVMSKKLRIKAKCMQYCLHIPSMRISGEGFLFALGSVFPANISKGHCPNLCAYAKRISCSVDAHISYWQWSKSGVNKTYCTVLYTYKSPGPGLFNYFAALLCTVLFLSDIRLWFALNWCCGFFPEKNFPS